MTAFTHCESAQYVCALTWLIIGQAASPHNGDWGQSMMMANLSLQPSHTQLHYHPYILFFRLKLASEKYFNQISIFPRIRITKLHLQAKFVQVQDYKC